MRRHYQYPHLYILLLISFFSIDSSAQGPSGDNWYFGNSNLGIRFGRGTGTASLINNKSAMSTGGGAVAADPFSGNVLFYTDGANVYDVTNTVMPNGTGLNANTASNQAVAVGAVPGQADQYYIFTNTAAGTIAYTIVDMAQFGNAVFPTPPLGAVTATKNVAIPGLTNRSGAMTLIPHSNGTDYWLVTQEAGTSNYAVTLVDASGTFPTTVYMGAGFSMTAANLEYNETAGQIAVSPQTANVDIHLLNFDNATGVISFNQTIPNTAVPASSGQAIYDVEWSSNGQYLYISVAGGAGVQADVLQYDLLNPTTTLASVLPQPNGIFASYGLQMGPDSTIYHLYQATSGGPYLLGGISETDTVATEVTYDPSVFAGNFGGTQFPSFLPQLNQTITINFTTQGTCSGVPTSFFPEVSPGADSLVWDFGDGFGSTSWAPIYTYENGGTYNVTVTAYLDGQTQTATVPVTITQFDLQLTLVQDTTACSCELPFPKATPPPPQCGVFEVTATVQGGNPVSQIWSNGDTGLTLTPDSAGYYYLVVTDASGCAAYAGVNIREYDVQDQRANIWYFGQNAGIDFNPLPEDPAVAIPGPVNSQEGVSVISDRNGQVVFSTDGYNIYNKNDLDITPTGGIGGSPNPSTQSAIIIQVPGDETLYYIFTTQEVYGTGTYELRYSLYDVKMNNGDGGLVEWNVLLFEPSTERLTGSGNWLIAHEFGNNSFRAYEITSNGISAPVISGAGSDHVITTEENAQGYMKLGPGNKLAVALSTPGVSNVIEVFDFNDSTGVVSNPQVADLNNTNGQVYGIEFSPTGNKMFATLSGSSSEIYEFAFDSLGNVYQKQPPPSNSFAEELGAMQMGPDGQIYIAANGRPYLYFFAANEDTTLITPLNSLQQFPLTGTSTLGLPNFIQNISSPVQGPTISANGTCLGDSTFFNGTGRDPNIEFYQWNFGDGQGTAASNNPEADHIYAAAGTYNVALTLSNRCDQDTILYTTVVITAPPAPPTFLQPGDVPVLCTGQLILEATPASNPDLAILHYVWTTGDTTRQITVNQQGNYGVTIVDDFGCSSDGSLIIADNRPMVELGPDLTLCQNTPVFPLDAQNPGATYQWEVNGVPTVTTQTQSVDTSVPGIFEYKVEVTDPITTCNVRDSLIYTFNQSPVFTATPNPPSSCGTPDGSIDILITDPATSLFTYSVTGPSPGTSAVDQPIGSYNVGSLVAGTYGVTVSDQISGCYTITTAAINDMTFTVSGTQNGTCDPISINVTTTAVAGPYSYRVIDNATNTVVDDGNPAPSTNNFTTKTVPSDNINYVVEVTAAGCTNSSPLIPINEADRVPVTLSPLPCANPITVNVSGGDTWFWTGGPNANITPGTETSASMTATPPQGPQVYLVNVQGAGYCPLDTTITVNVDNMVVPALAQSDGCEDQVVVTASPNGAYLYRWYRNGTLDPALGSNQVIATTANNGQQYRVDLYNPVSGCTFNSPAVTVNVIGALDLTLTTTPACEGDDFIITGTTNQTVPSYVWSYEGSVINGQTSSTLLDTRAGEYKAEVTLSGCNAADSLTILLSPITPGSLVSRAVICNDPANSDPNTNQVVLDPGAGFDSYAWFRNGVALGVTDPTYTATEDGTYSVDLVNPFGCESSDETVVEIECLPRIVAPNAFRPDGEVNPDFFVYTFFIDDAPFEVFIFSRWGELVYQSVERQFKWNGSYNNNVAKPLPPGTYSYVVRYRSSYRPEDGIQEQRGGVVLLR